MARRSKLRTLKYRFKKVRKVRNSKVWFRSGFKKFSSLWIPIQKFDSFGADLLKRFGKFEIQKFTNHHTLLKKFGKFEIQKFTNSHKVFKKFGSPSDPHPKIQILVARSSRNSAVRTAPVPRGLFGNPDAARRLLKRFGSPSDSRPQIQILAARSCRNSPVGTAPASEIRAGPVLPF